MYKGPEAKRPTPPYFFAVTTPPPRRILALDPSPFAQPILLNRGGGREKEPVSLNEN